MKGDVDYDFILAFVMFISIYTSVFQMLPYMTSGSNEAKDIILMESTHLSETLVKSPGYPRDWNATSVTKLGLAYYGETYRPNILDYYKITEINGTDCAGYADAVDTAIGFKITVVTNAYSLGCSNTPDAYARVIERPVMVYNGVSYEPGIMRLHTWVELA